MFKFLQLLKEEQARPRLTVKQLALPIHLGVSRKERTVFQEVLFSVAMEFKKNPEAERTDSCE